MNMIQTRVDAEPMLLKGLIHMIQIKADEEPIILIWADEHDSD